MRVAVEKLDGVVSAEVSLNDGHVAVALEEDNHVRLDRLREVIRDQGFTPREATLRARGIVERRDGGLVFRTPDGEIVLEVEGGPDVMATVEGRLGESLVLSGRVDEAAPRTLRVTGVG